MNQLSKSNQHKNLPRLSITPPTHLTQCQTCPIPFLRKIFLLCLSWAWGYSFWLFFQRLFIFGTERDRAWTGEGQRERETQNRKQAPGSEPSAQSLMGGSNSWTARSWPGWSRTPNRLRHLGAPISLYYNHPEIHLPGTIRLKRVFFWLPKSSDFSKRKSPV